MVHVSTGENSGFQFKTHPNIDKKLYAAESILGLKDPARPFPLESDLGAPPAPLLMLQGNALLPF